MQDITVDKQGKFWEDDENNCVMEAIYLGTDGSRVARWRRALHTCQPGDYVIRRETTQFLLAAGQAPEAGLNAVDVGKAIVPGRLIRDTDPPPQPPPADASKMNLQMSAVRIPSKVTTYWCTVFELPKFNTKQHIVKYEPIISKGNEHIVHHMEVYLCQRPEIGQILPYNGECLEGNMPAQVRTCKQVIGAWAMGAEPFSYPPEAGLPVGEDGFYPYAMLEIHYNNEKMESGVIDNSGMRFYVTPTLRPNDAGILETGLIYSDVMAIPPAQDAFALHGHCVPECTDEGLPPDGINIFASQLHAHKTGRQLCTHIVRNGVMAEVVNCDAHFTQHWQEIRPVHPPVNVRPGDHLLTTCVFNTANKKQPTLGGYGIEDEMCVNYIHYYPRAPLEVCKSAVNNRTLHTFLRGNRPQSTLTRLEDVLMTPSIARQWRDLDWTEPALVADLREMYASAPLNMECLGHGGKPLKGKWSHVPHPPVFASAIREEDDCDNDEKDGKLIVLD